MSGSNYILTLIELYCNSIGFNEAYFGRQPDSLTQEIQSFRLDYLARRPTRQPFTPELECVEIAKAFCEEEGRGERFWPSGRWNPHCWPMWGEECKKIVIAVSEIMRLQTLDKLEGNKSPANFRIDRGDDINLEQDIVSEVKFSGSPSLAVVNSSVSLQPIQTSNLQHLHTLSPPPKHYENTPQYSPFIIVVEKSLGALNYDNPIEAHEFHDVTLLDFLLLVNERRSPKCLPYMIVRLVFTQHWGSREKFVVDVATCRDHIWRAVKTQMWDNVLVLTETIAVETIDAMRISVRCEF